MLWHDDQFVLIFTIAYLPISSFPKNLNCLWIFDTYVGKGRKSTTEKKDEHAYRKGRKLFSDQEYEKAIPYLSKAIVSIYT